MAKRRHRSSWGTVVARYRRGTDEQAGWVARYVSPILGDGSVNKNFPMDGKGQAEAWLEAEHALVRRHEAGEIAWQRPSERKKAKERANILFRDYAIAWLNTHHTAKGERPRGSTLRKLKVDITHLLPTFGDKRLADIGIVSVNAWLDHNDIEGEYAVFNAYKTLKAIMRAASNVDENGEPPIIESSPCTRPLGAPKSRQATIKPPTAEQLKAIYDAMPEYDRIAVYLSATAGGLRVGEVCGLERGDVDLPNRMLHVRNGINRGVSDRGQLQRGELKTEASRRDVHIPERLVPLLERHMKTFTGPDAKDSLLHPVKVSIMSRQELYNHFKKAARKAGRPDLHFHTLRATAATSLVSQGATLAETMHALGHSDSRTAVERYQRVIDDHAKAMSDKIGDALIPAERTPETIRKEINEKRAQIKTLKQDIEQLMRELDA